MIPQVPELTGYIRYILGGIGLRQGEVRRRMQSTYDYVTNTVYSYEAEEEMPHSMLVSYTRVEEIFDDDGNVKKVLRTEMQATYELTEMVEKRR